MQHLILTNELCLIMFDKVIINADEALGGQMGAEGNRGLLSLYYC